MSSVWIFNIVIGVIVLIGLFYVAKKAKKMSADKAAEPSEA